ncbi:related to alpha-amylase A precursor [Ramularia collo-cygni]|uniref:alpha-amylase n=1 Tax=Ramularia collo-cygni TaxID=112498 RepID=A0A2D3UQL3_9PEZI|nr:related to alpha-amylase A precursor [Ramularia collo-cygni]CZT18071.1 related to alpha-amylase A precursor [Ramularia collo-cygni]
MARLSSFVYIFLSLWSLGNCLNSAGWRSQSIYQVLTDRFARTDGSTSGCSNLSDYCGGTWRGLINKLDYIQGMGFTAVWISPVVKNPIGLTSNGNSYHGYWAQDAYAVNPKFGTSDDLKSLSAALHQRGMYLMVDVVPNHMGSLSTKANIDYGGLHPFNNKRFYHDSCSIDYNNADSIKYCWVSNNDVAPLPDLRTEDQEVQQMWNTWISQLVSNYSIDGLRIDTAQQVNQGFWPGFQSAAGGIHTLGEVFNGNPDVMCPYQNSLYGLLNYGTYYWITQAFQSASGSIANLANGINQMKQTCKDTTLLGSFIENHDNPRFPSKTSDQSQIKNAIAFTILQDGIPIIYQGQEHKFSGTDTPGNREALWTSNYNKNSDLYLHIQKLNKIRSWAIRQDSNYAGGYKAYPIYSDGQNIIMRKGFGGKQIVSVYTNKGANGSGTLTIQASNSGFTANQQVTEIITCSAKTADGNGNLVVSYSQGLPSVLYPTAALAGSGICGK